MPETVRLRDPEGQIVDVDVTRAASYLQDPRWSVPTADDEAGRVSDLAREAEYGGVGGAIAAGAAGAARGLTGGLSDAALVGLGGEDTRIALEGYRDVNPGASIGGEILGAVAPAILTGGTSVAASAAGAGARGAGTLGRIAAATPAGAASLAGRSVARAAGGGVRGATAGGVVEGGLQGIGTGISELALSDDPLTIERAASAIGSNLLFGAGVGGAAGGLVKGAELGLGRAKGAIDDALARRAAKATNAAEAVDSGDLSLLDKRALDALEKDELARLHDAAAPQREALIKDVDAFRRVMRDEHRLRSAVATSLDKDAVEAGASFSRNNVKLRNMLDDKVGVAEKPELLRPRVRSQGQALEEILEYSHRAEAQWQRELAEAPARIREEILDQMRPSKSFPGRGGGAVKYPDEMGPFTEEGLDAAVDRVLKERMKFEWGAGAAADGLRQPVVVRLRSEYERVLDWNKQFQAKLDELAKPPTSERLTKIADARTALDIPQSPSLGAAVLGVATPFAGPIGVAATAGAGVLRNFRRLIDASAVRAGKAASSFLAVAEKGARKAERYAPVVATKTLAEVAFSDEKRKKAPENLPELFKARTDEIKSQIFVAEDGSYRIRPEARAKIAAKLDGMRAADPVGADRLEEIAVRRIEWLASQVPRRPDAFSTAYGPDRWQPSDMAMRAWARKVAAVEDPHAVLERVTDGTVTPEDAAAIRAVYPGLMQDFITQVTEQLPSLQKALPYKRRLALSIFSGVPVDPSMDPRVLKVLQDQFPEEPGTAGGTQAPLAAPQFGSIKKSPDQPTPAQARGANV